LKSSDKKPDGEKNVQRRSCWREVRESKIRGRRLCERRRERFKNEGEEDKFVGGKKKQTRDERVCEKKLLREGGGGTNYLKPNEGSTPQNR